MALPQLLRGLPACRLRPLDIDLVRALGGVGQDDDAVVAHLEEATRDRHHLFGAAFDDAYLARRERGDEGSVLWQDGELAVRTRRDHFVYPLLGVDELLGRDDLDGEGHGAPYAFVSSFASFSAFSSTMSSVPTR